MRNHARPHVLSALQDKAHELRQAIVTYEEQLGHVRHELAVVTACHARIDSALLFAVCSHMRLSSYPYVTVRIACARCPRHGSYRLARLADRYGAEMTMPHLLELLSADCKQRERGKIAIYDRCAAYFPDLGGGRPPDEPMAE